MFVWGMCVCDLAGFLISPPEGDVAGVLGRMVG
jgi:hypothetical protein